MSVCMACEFDGLGFPCRNGASFDSARVAAAYLDGVLRASDDAAVNHWSFDCLDAQIEDAPDLAWAVIALLADAVETPLEAASLSAGPLESLIYKHGSAVIDRLEDHARQSPRFRYILTGVWPQGQNNGEVWQRVEQARAGAAHIDRDPMPNA